jgi:hypothetical protein
MIGDQEPELEDIDNGEQLNAENIIPNVYTGSIYT